MKKIMISVPVGNGQITYDCHEAINRNTHNLRDNGIEVIPYYHPCHIYIDQARNICVKQFLKSDCSDLVFIDSDVSFDNDAVFRLFRNDKDIVGGIYPFRQDRELGFPGIIEFNEQNNCKEEETGLVYAKMIPTGFMRIQRRVFEWIIDQAGSVGDLPYPILKDSSDTWNFFRTGILFKDDNNWYGEDVAFCMWWKQMGKELFIEPNINFSHTGMKQFKGNFHEYLMGRSVVSWQEGIDKNSDGLDGWMTVEEMSALRELAGQSDSVVEVGSWKGRSTKVFLESCKGPVYAVDHWKGTPSDLSSMAVLGRDIMKDFLANVGHYPNLHILKGESSEIAKSFNGNRVDTVFLDADHSYEGLKLDIESWLPKCDKFISGHDYDDHFPGVVQAVNEKFGIPKTKGSVWWVEL